MFFSLIYFNVYSLPGKLKPVTSSDLPVFKKIREAILSLKTSKSTCLDNSSAEIIRKKKKHWTKTHLSIKE